jgi:glycosyl transferase family 87
VVDHLWYAESEFLILFLLVWAFSLLRSGRSLPAGTLIALAALLKGYPVAMGGYLLVTGRWKALASAMVAGATGVLGASAWIEFAALNSKDTFAYSLNNLSLSGFIWRMYTKVFAAHAIAGVRLALVVAALVGVMACTCWLTRSREQAAHLRSYSLWVVAMLIVPPIVWLSYLPLLAIPIFDLASDVESTGTISLGAAAMALSVALLFTLTPLFPSLLQSRGGRLIAEYQFLALALAYLLICATMTGKNSRSTRIRDDRDAKFYLKSNAP